MIASSPSENAKKQLLTMKEAILKDLNFIYYTSLAKYQDCNGSPDYARITAYETGIERLGEAFELFIESVDKNEY